MATLDVLDWNKKKTGTVEVSDDIFDRPFRKDLLHTIVRWQLAKRRQGTHQVKTRTTISGTGKKPFKQKGTGNARQGNRRSPLLEGGSVIHGPQPRNYEYSLPKKVKKAAMKVALSHLLREGKLFVVEDMASEGKTKELSQRLKGFGVDKGILISEEINEKMARASRNLPKHRYMALEGINVYDLLKYDVAILTKGSVEKLGSRLGAE